MIRLFTSAYPESNPDRRQELEICLQNNVNSLLFDSIHLLLENVERPAVEADSLRTRHISSRPTYLDYFNWINEVATSDDISIIANSDIYFDENAKILDALLSVNRCVALSRWDVQPNDRVRLWERGDSHDSWAFRGPVRENLHGDFPVGVYFCDNKIAWEMEQADYKVINPAFSLRSYHLHQGEERSYDPDNPADHGIRPPFRYIEPDNAGSLLFCLRLWRTFNMDYFPWRITWRKLGRTLPFSLLVRVWNRMRRTISP